MKNLVLVKALEGIAHKKGCQPAQLALAWLASQGVNVFPIPGTTKRTHLDENLAAMNLTLSNEDLALISEIAPRGIAAGDRYPAWGMAWING